MSADQGNDFPPFGFPDEPDFPDVEPPRDDEGAYDAPAAADSAPAAPVEPTRAAQVETPRPSPAEPTRTAPEPAPKPAGRTTSEPEPVRAVSAAVAAAAADWDVPTVPVERTDVTAPEQPAESQRATDPVPVADLVQAFEPGQSAEPTRAPEASEVSEAASPFEAEPFGQPQSSTQTPPADSNASTEDRPRLVVLPSQAESTSDIEDSWDAAAARSVHRPEPDTSSHPAFGRAMNERTSGVAPVIDFPRRNAEPPPPWDDEIPDDLEDSIEISASNGMVGAPLVAKMLGGVVIDELIDGMEARR